MGHPLDSLIVDTEIERLRAENKFLRAELNESKRKVETDFAEIQLLDVLESMNDAFFAVDKNWNISRVNANHEKVTHLARADQVGKNFFDVFPAVDSFPSRFGREARRAMENRSKHYFEDFYEPLNIFTAVNAYPTSDGGLAIFYRDITAEKKVAEQIEMEKQKFEAIFLDTNAAMVLLKGKDLVIEKANQKYLEMLGNRDLIGKTFDEAFPELRSDPFNEILARVFETGEPYIGKEVPAKVASSYERKHAPESFFDFTYSRINDGEGNPYGIYCIAYDVTDRVMARREIEESESRYRILTEVSPQVVWSAKADGQIVYANRFWFDYTGFSLEQTLGHGWIDAIHPDYRDEVLRVWLNAARNKSEYELEIPFRRAADGSFRWHLAKGLPVLSAEGIIEKWVGVAIDIHERKVSQDQSRESEARLRSIIESIPQGIWQCTADGQAVYFSERFYKLVGYSAQEFLGWKWADYIHPEDRPRVLEEWQKSRDAHAVAAADFRIRLKSGEYRWFLSIGNPSVEDDGKVLNYWGTWTDITAEKLIQEKFRESELRFRLMADTLPQIVWIGDPSGAIIYASRQWFDYTGLSWDQTAGEGWAQAVHVEDYEQARDKWQVALRNNQPVVSEYRLRRRDGTFRHQLIKGLPVFDHDGNVIHWLGTLTDIHDQKQQQQDLILSEQRLKESESRLRALADNIFQLAWMAEPDGSIFWYNRRWYDYTGMTPEATLGWGWEKVLHPDHENQVLEFISNAWTEGAPWELTTPLRKSSGEWRWFLTRAVPIRNAQGELIRWFGTNTDIDDQKRVEEELTRSNAELARFAFVASHDLKEPLRVVSMYAQMLGSNYRGKLDQTAEQYINFMVDGVDRMYALINDLLNYSAIDGKTTDFEPVDFNQSLSDALNNLESLAKDSRTTIIKLDLLPTLHADSQQITQLFQNLIANGIKYRSTVDPLIKISAEKKNGQWIFCVEDNGIGIEKKYFEKIFVLFQRLHRQNEYSGTGIGLAICKKVVERHGGKIWLESTPQKGSRFFFYIPERPAGVTKPALM